MSLLKKIWRASQRNRLVLTVAAFTTVALVASAALHPFRALSTDNITGVHWHEEKAQYRLHADSLPFRWREATQDAAQQWNRKTAFTLRRGANIGHHKWRREGSHIVWQGSIPPAFQDGCPPATSVACARVVFFAGKGPKHIFDADFVFDRGDPLSTSNERNCGSLFALYNDIDVESVGLHEFGHWGQLAHTSDSNAVMRAQAFSSCKRVPTQHDIDSMNGIEHYGG
jgi:hypothetical protein